MDNKVIKRINILVEVNKIWFDKYRKRLKQQYNKIKFVDNRDISIEYKNIRRLINVYIITKLKYYIVILIKISRCIFQQ